MRLILFSLLSNEENLLGNSSMIFMMTVLTWCFFGWGSEFQLQNQGVGLVVHWCRGGKVVSGNSGIVIVAVALGGRFLGTVSGEEGHVNVHG
jgi:hypothetical protein